VSARDAILRLSARRRQCAELAAQGMSNREIGAALRISEHTVANYLWHIYNLTGCDNRTQLAVLFMSVKP
jgi:DNA-binding CsgD family transcriptional regulator